MLDFCCVVSQDKAMIKKGLFTETGGQLGRLEMIAGEWGEERCQRSPTR